MAKPRTKQQQYNSTVYGSTMGEDTTFCKCYQAAASYGSDKVIYHDPWFSVNIVDTGKYGWQVQLQAWGGPISFAPRNSDEYQRMEIMFNEEHLDELIELLIRKKLERDGIT